MYTPSWQWCSLMAVAYSSRLMHLATLQIFQEWSEELDKEFKVLNSPDFNLTEHLCDVLDQQIKSMEASLH